MGMRLKTIAFTTFCALQAALVAGHAENGASNEKDVMDEAIKSNDHKELSSAMHKAGKANLLKGQSAITFFAPTDAAFAEQQGGAVGDMMRGKDQAKLAKLLDCHTLAGKMTTLDLMKKVREGRGSFDATTIGGCKLNFTVESAKIVVQDEQGGKAKITASSDTPGAALVQTVDHVLQPKQ